MQLFGQQWHSQNWGDSKKAWKILEMINPVNHARSPEEVARYKVEPYVIAADVYALSPHIGRGGWTWYTGSAGWMYRLIVESLLGLRLEADKLYIDPCLPSEWVSYKIYYRYRETIYRITFNQLKASESMKITIILDGAECQEKFIRLVDDRQGPCGRSKTIPRKNIRPKCLNTFSAPLPHLNKLNKN